MPSITSIYTPTFSNKRRGYSFYYDSVCDDYLVKTSQNMRRFLLYFVVHRNLRTFSDKTNESIAMEK